MQIIMTKNINSYEKMYSFFENLYEADGLNKDVDSSAGVIGRDPWHYPAKVMGVFDCKKSDVKKVLATFEKSEHLKILVINVI